MDGGRRLTVNEVRTSLLVTRVEDYVIFFIIMIATSVIGLLYARRTKGAATGANEYLYAGDKMSVFPISVSLIASAISCIALMGNPALIYLYGIEFGFHTFTAIIAALLCHFIFFPVLFKLKLPSTYMYLYHRFDNSVRWLTSLCFTISMMFRVPIIIYLPSLVLQQASGINTIVIAAVMSSVCIFYTCIGGIRAVVWNDVIQTLLMLGTMLMIIVKGTQDSGGLQNVLNAASRSGRLEFPSLSIDLTTENSLLSEIFGATIFNLTYNILNQMSMQRFNTFKTTKEVTRALMFFIIGHISFITMANYIGLVAHSYFEDCDPLQTGLAHNKNEIVPILVMETLGKFRGLLGLFFVGAFSATLSTMSTTLNSVPAVILEDFIKPLWKTPIPDHVTLIILKLIVVLFGLLCLGLVLLVEASSSSILVLSVSLESISSGPLAALFTMGVLLPFINSKGALWGGFSGMGFVGVIVAGSQIAQMKGYLAVPQKPLRADNCSYEFNLKDAGISRVKTQNVLPLIKIAFLWYPFIGFMVTIIVACTVSYFTGFNSGRAMDSKYFSPYVQRWLPQQTKHEKRVEKKLLEQRKEEDQ